MHRGSIALTAALLTLLAVLAFLAVLNFAITKPENTNSTNSNQSTNGNVNIANTNVSNTNSDRTLITNTTNTNTVTDPTTGWKTYQNTEHRFQFRYPNDWLVEERNNQPLSGRTETYDLIQFYIQVTPTNPSSTNRMDKFNFSVFPRQGSESAEVTYQRLSPTDLTGLTSQTLTVGGEVAVLYVGFPGFTSSDGIFFANNNSSFLTRSYIETNERSAVLATLTFTDLTAGWQAYTSADLGITAKYPAGWYVTACGDAYAGFDLRRGVCESEYGSGFNIKKWGENEHEKNLQGTKQSLTNVVESVVTAGDYPATRVEGQGGGLSPTTYSVYVFVKLSDRSLVIHYLNSTSIVKNEAEVRTFDSFISALELAR